MIVYGIKNCNTVKSALAWLKKRKIEFEFHDYKTRGVDEKKLKQWIGQVGWERMVNRNGTTWRKLDDKAKTSVTNEKTAIALMMEKTSVIKRPLVERDGKIIVLGFDEAEYKAKLS